MEEKDIVFSAYSRKLLRELKNTRLLLEKGDIKGAKKLLEEIIDETYADIEIEQVPFGARGVEKLASINCEHILFELNRRKINVILCLSEA